MLWLLVTERLDKVTNFTDEITQKNLYSTTALVGYCANETYLQYCACNARSYGKEVRIYLNMFQYLTYA